MGRLTVVIVALIGVLLFVVWPRNSPMGVPPTPAADVVTYKASERSEQALESPRQQPEPAADKLAVEPETRRDILPRPQPGPGSIDGMVLRRDANGESPIAGLSVDLIQGFEPVPDDPTSLSPRVVGRARSAADGSFRFTDLALADDYSVRAVLSHHAVREVQARLRADAPHKKIVLVFGTGSIRGRLLDVDGQPVPNHDASIVSYLETNDLKESLADACRTDADGWFAFRELPAAPWDFAMRESSGSKPEWVDRVWHIDLAEGEHLALGLDGMLQTTRLRGSFKPGNAESFGPRFVIQFDRDDRSTNGSTYHTVQTAHCWEQGTDFDLFVQSGSWKVSVAQGGASITLKAGLQDLVLPELLTIEGREVVHDIVLPGPAPR